jgi:hypothetical protein
MAKRRGNSQNGFIQNREQSPKIYYVVDEDGNVLGSRKEVLNQLGLQLLPSGSRNTASQLPPLSTTKTSAHKQSVPAARNSPIQNLATVKPANNSKRPNTAQLVRCPHCNCNVKQSKLAGHIARVHPMTRALVADGGPVPSKAPASLANASGKVTPAPQKSTSTLSNLVKCPICAVDVRSDRLEKHKLKVHNQSSPTPLISSKQLQTAKWVLCPTCGVRMKPGELTTHLTKAHHQSSTTKASRQPNSLGYEQAAKPDDDAFRQDSVELRDGGKYLGYIVREHGRYGTLPLYDDYGDDSDAE